MDNTPNYANSPIEQKPSRKKTIWLVLIILALIASNTGWALFYLKQQGELTAQINTLKAQNLKLTKDNKDLQSKDDSVDTTAYREIPEVGIKYKVTDTTKNLTYSYDPINDVISFSTVELIKAGGENKENPGTNMCSSESGAGGRIVRIKAGEKYDGVPGEETPIEQVKEAKKIGNYYYVFAHVQGYCGEGNVATLAKSANDSTKAAFDSLKAN